MGRIVNLGIVAAFCAFASQPAGAVSVTCGGDHYGPEPDVEWTFWCEVDWDLSDVRMFDDMVVSTIGINGSNIKEKGSLTAYVAMVATGSIKHWLAKRPSDGFYILSMKATARSYDLCEWDFDGEPEGEATVRVFLDDKGGWLEAWSAGPFIDSD